MAEEKRVKLLDKEISIVEGVTASKDGGVLTFKGPKGENSRVLFSPSVDIVVESDKITLKPAKKSTKREYKRIRTFAAHISNLMQGVSEGFEYKLKICSGHFPMNVSISGSEFVIKNFIGEKIPRKVPVKDGVKVDISGDMVTVTGIDKEKVGQMAASIEELTKRPGFDTRIFQDGIYIIEKAGKKITA